jgi:hypothetical protein
MKNNKKVLKISVLVFVVFIAIAVAFPFVFKGKIIELLKQNLNNNLNAKVDFEEADLSVFRNFPNATVSIDQLAVINKEPFAGDTLFRAGDIELTMGLAELFKSASEVIQIKSFKVNEAKLDILVNKQGQANYDITKNAANSKDQPEAEKANFEFSVDTYEITNATVHYFDQETAISLAVDDINHYGEGDLSLQNSELNTVTDAKLSFTMDSVNYLNRNPVKLNALIGVDLKNNVYSFLKNEGIINQLPLVFEGFVKLNNDNKEVKITFKTPSSDFKNFLALIPETYSKNIENVRTSGEFVVSGVIDGVIDETHIPGFNISMQSDNAMFQYPNLPNAVENINIKTFVVNKTGLTKDTYIDIQKLSFTIAKDVFNVNARFSNLIENPFISAHIKGRLNLANVKNAYPVPKTIPLSGILDADVTTAFDMKTIESGHYEKTRNSGNLALTGFTYESEELAQPLTINKTDLTFNPKTVTLNSLNAKIGQTDLQATGSITNLLGYMFANEDIKGNFKMNSDTFVVNDFMVNEPENKSNENNDSPQKNEKASIKIPSFLNCIVKASANTVIYDNITLKDVNGTLIIADEKATLVNLNSSVFDGGLVLEGSVSTKTETPVFDMNLNINAFNIASSFKQLDLFNALAPLADAVQGKLNAKMSLSGGLNNDFTPNLNSVSGNALAEFLSSKIKPENSKMLSLVTNQLQFVDLTEVNLENLKTSLSFENGKVRVKPFKISYKDIDITAEGSHGFDKTLGYGVTFNVPAKYLGKQASGLIANLKAGEKDSIKIPVTANISGSFSNPQVSTDLKNAITTLTKELAAREKDKLVGKGKDAVKDVLGDLLGKEKVNDSTVVQDSTNKKDPVKDAAGTLIKGLFGKKKKKKDSVSN